MAVLMILDWQGVSTDDDDRVNEVMGIRSDADAPETASSRTRRR
jgi:hypothetical protein